MRTCRVSADVCCGLWRCTSRSPLPCGRVHKPGASEERALEANHWRPIRESADDASAMEAELRPDRVIEFESIQGYARVAHSLRCHGIALTAHTPCSLPGSCSTSAATHCKMS